MYYVLCTCIRDTINNGVNPAPRAANPVRRYVGLMPYHCASRTSLMIPCVQNS